MLFRSYIAHSRGWTAEDMETNVQIVQHSQELKEAAEELVARAVDMAQVLTSGAMPTEELSRGGRKAHRLEMETGMNKASSGA